MYTDMYNTFDKECIPYSYPFSFRGNNKFDYMENKNLPVYEMDYEDTTVIPFCIGEPFRDHYINIIVYNFRYEEIYRENHIVDEDGKVRFQITSMMSSNIFKRGRYFVRIQAEYSDEEYENVCTLIHPSDCVIRVR